MRFLWFVLLLAFVTCGPGVSALRCYKCEDCDENTQLSDMEMCDGPLMSGNGQGTPAGFSPSPSPVPGGAPSPAPPAPSPAPGAPAPAPSPSAPSDASEEEDYESEEPATVGIMAAGNGAGGAGGGAAGAGGAAGGAAGGTVGGASGEAGVAVSEEEEEEDEEEEEEERRKRRSIARQVDLDMPIAFCYTVRLNLNESVITKRGCTTARMSNQTGGCDGLFENWTVAGCQLCQDDGCNQPITGSSSRNIGQSWTFLALTLMAFMTRYLGN
ncbi:E3 ubiquitin-protein ligase HECW2 [Drosophila rhopaloa]|uniref:E3 ubiquitin-protein ligase HECW2 n=1 Tax=Drosophila rhopaloa TaxID=1041015 RepID=A0A6P4FIV2_DRORH|nr:E3 ubiquitin-protein ligase HECW2 [Drosophila rhopaloa]